MKTQVVSPSQVLLVEDDKSVARMLGIPLRSAGFQVTVAHTGLEALRLLEDQAVEAVILDLGFPDGRGEEVLDRVRSRSLAPSLAWVVITALSMDEAADRYGNLADHLLTKPFDPWILVHRLEQFLAQKGN